MRLPGSIALWLGAIIACQANSDQTAPTPSGDSLPLEFSQHSDAELKWRGLSTLYPDKVVIGQPPSFTPHSPREPLKAELPNDVTYLRVYDLTLAMDALTEIASERKLVLDLRYLGGNVPGGFATTLEKARVDNPAIVLVNHRTAGPVEVTLADLQADNRVLLVGMPTAGQTGKYRAVNGVDNVYLLENEDIPKTGESLLGKGLSPNIAVEIEPEDDYRAYHLVERGTPIERVLDIDFEVEVNGPAESDVVETSAMPADASLQRALDVIVALQVLGKLPPS